MRKKHLTLVLVTLTWMFAACDSRTETLFKTRTLTVFAAASLTEAFQEIGQHFEDVHPGVDVIYNFSASQNLRLQIEQGAMPDVFASASTKEMDILVSDAFVDGWAVEFFLTNKIIVILPANNPGQVTELSDLTRSGLLIVLAADEVPVGMYAHQVLENLNALYGNEYKTRVLENVVSNEENVKLVVAKVQLGEADAGLVYISDAVATSELITIEIPDAYNISAEYPIAALKDASETALAGEFIAYILSDEGQRVLDTWGFTPVMP